MSQELAFEVGRFFPLIKNISDQFMVQQKQIFLHLPGVEGYFPGGTIDDSGRSINMIDDGENLADTGTCQIGYDGQAYRSVGDGVSYLSNQDAFGITGTETEIEANLRGLTIGGWFRIPAGPPTNRTGLAGKYGAPTTDYGYALTLGTNDKADFRVSPTGVSLVTVEGGIVVDDEWHYIVGRFTPSTEVAIFVDEAKTVETVSVPAACNIAGEAFEVGRYEGNNLYIQYMFFRDLFVCRAALPDALVEQVRQASQP